MRKSRDVQLFSFSFVDILATTIGVLLFILLMAVINQSGFVECSQWAKTVADTESERDQAARDVAQARAQYELAQKQTREAMEDMPPDAKTAARKAQDLAEQNARLATSNRERQKKVAALQEQAAAVENRVQRLRQQPDTSGSRRYMLPKAEQRSNEIAIHVDCRSDGVVILGSDVSAANEGRETCPTDDIGKTNSAFGRLIKQLQQRPEANPDTVRFKNGKVLRGKIIEETNNGIVLLRQTGRGSRAKLPFKKSAIAEITRGKSERHREKVIVLWVRPDGISAADAAIKAAKKAKVPLGWEPADADWVF